MIPQFEVLLEDVVPTSYVPWVPRPGEIDEEGFGNFRGTWALGRVPQREAHEVLGAESELVSFVDALAGDAAMYDQLAAALESGDPADLPDHATRGDAWAQLEPYFGYTWLRGLELGVAGLVMALATIGGCHPAASCRAHTSRNSWSPYPVVLLAADEFRARHLERHVGRAGCGFAIDSGRPEFLAIGAPSVRPMMSLAREILANAAEFRRPRGAARTRRPRRVGYEQGVLDLFGRGSGSDRR